MMCLDRDRFWNEMFYSQGKSIVLQLFERDLFREGYL